MKKVISFFICLLYSTWASADVADPLGLSEYVYTASPNMNVPQAGSHRLTNLEVKQYTKLGLILPDGSLRSDITTFAHIPLPLPTARQAASSGSKNGKAKLVRKPLPSSSHIAQQTGTLPVGHPDSQGAIQVRPTNMPDNPTHEQIMHMKRDIKHIENTVGKALNLSLSAYAVAELPQATNGRSSFSMGVAANDGKNAEAVGYSTNFGRELEYTIKVSVSHAGSENAAGAGFNYQW